ncbi:MAG: hypothetical protein JST54_24450 [Deltaproteobacteria bacterium]|nr:hypothetical protein [Deltaproteobacteria bacterium]
MRVLAVAIVALGLLACSGSPTPDGGATDAGPVDAGGVDAGVDAGPSDAGWWPLDAGANDAGHRVDAGPPEIPPDAELQLPDHGGPRLARAELVTLTFAGFPFESELEAFGDFLPGSHWVHEVGDEYGVTVVGHAQYTAPGIAPSGVDYGDIHDLVLAGIDAGLWPAQPGDAGGTPIWMVIYPPGTAPAGIGQGEHFEFDDDGGAWVASYITQYGTPQATDYEDLISHEVVEALTDPYIQSAPALIQFPLEGIWSNGSGEEVGDLCEDAPPVLESGFQLTRAWSNAASMDGGDPCQPLSSEVFAKVLAPTTPVLASADQDAYVTLQGVEVGSSAPFAVSVMESGAQDFRPTLDHPTVAPGGALQLTLRVPYNAQSGTRAWFAVTSTPANDAGRPFDVPVELMVR